MVDSTREFDMEPQGCNDFKPNHGREFWWQYKFSESSMHCVSVSIAQWKGAMQSAQLFLTSLQLSITAMTPLNYLCQGEPTQFGVLF